MKAVVLLGTRLEFRDNYQKPIHGAGEALIRVAVAGICNTDLDLVQGYFGFYGIPGHEFTGVVEEADNIDLIGKRVVGEINCPCGLCQLCRLGLGRHCRSRTVLGLWKRDGAFAEFLTLPEANLHLVPDEMPDETAVFAEPTSTAFAILERIDPKPSDRCVVVGDVTVGILSAQVLSRHCSATILCNNPHTLAVARGFGLDAVMRDALTERDFDAAVEVSGTGSGMNKALDVLRPAGKILLTTNITGDTPVPLWKVSSSEIDIIGLRRGSFPRAMAALSQKTVRVAPLVSARYPIDQIQAALDRHKEPGTIKVLVYPAAVP